uniref:angiopoietin-related protein 6 n=1 Tax=Doryrhamphus excisus TaxID=161450 RepID=UPI0025AEB0F6|nr:angiopoietin-related protein 6 [Doryrhamphus excisus]XP_057905855.1 angiopoietin-related protein 6 [Doryrhamphus excisus]XP_057905856.1 angiopoietin-related protein 6 [Doryrhamphus excisus]XP_057905857.1 angiopoietin-related protein 6 [Doryrhamphus excisus]XP_057905858.1 angiopoietin-related protein 6 [Doryrhamphus excisus]
MDNKPAVILLLTLMVGSQSETPEKHPPSTADIKASRCSYTFIVPQQKLSGALCLDTQAASAAHQSEMAAMRVELKRQQGQLENLQALLEQEGNFAMEIRALRKESSSMNSRIAQLYSQLLLEVIHKKDHVLEQRRVENLLLNATTHALQVSSNFRELEKKYGALTSLMTSQSQLIAHLEKQCRCTDSSQADQVVATDPPKSPSGVHLNDSSEISNDLQRDQSASLQQDNPMGAHLIPVTPASPPTEHPVISFPVTKTPGPWRDCQHVLESGETTSGIYLLRLQSANRLLQAWCEQNQAQGGWTVIQRRQDGSVNFFRTWEQYKQGFGNLDGEYWLGLEHLYWLTKQAKYKLRVVLEDWQGRQVFAEYDSFRVEAETDWYRLRLGQYRGNAGDSLTWHNNKAFTTLDRDKDGYSGNCAHFQKGGWWYHMCAHSNLNGVWYRGGHYRSRYQDGVYWAEFHGGSYSLRRVFMMVKPT